MIGRRIFSARGSPMTNISFQVSCIAGSPPRGARSDHDKGGAPLLPENGGRVTRTESQLKPAVLGGHPVLWYSHFFATLSHSITYATLRFSYDEDHQLSAGLGRHCSR